MLTYFGILPDLGDLCTFFPDHVGFIYVDVGAGVLARATPSASPESLR
jgi:hypothetical protein